MQSPIQDWDSELSRYRRNVAGKRVSVVNNAPKQVVPTKTITSIVEDDDDDDDDSMIQDERSAQDDGIDEAGDMVGPLASDVNGQMNVPSDVGSDDEDNSAPWNARPVNRWMEYQSVDNPRLRVFYNPHSNQVTTTKPYGEDGHNSPVFGEPWSEDYGGRHREMRSSGPSFDKDRAADRCREAINVIAQQAEFCSMHASLVSREFQDSVLALKTSLANMKAALSAVEEVAMEEGNTIDFLIGWKQLRWSFNNNEAVDYYRACSKKSDHKAIAYTQWHFPEYYSNQPILPTAVKANCVVRLPANDRIQQTTVMVGIDELVSSAIHKAYTKLPKTGDIGPESDYVLKVTGHREYLAEDKLFFSYAHVRKCLRDVTDVELTLCRRPESFITQEMRDREEANVVTYQKKINPDIHPLEKYTFCDLLDIANKDWSVVRNLSYLPMSAVNVPFQAKIVGLENINSDTFPRLTSDVSQIFVRVCLFHGTQYLSWNHELPSLDVAGDVLRWHMPLIGGQTCLISLLPRETRIGFVVMGRKEEKEVPLGWVCSQIINFKGHLEAGTVRYNLWAFPAKEGKKHGKKRDVDPNFLFRDSTIDNNTLGINKAVLTVEYPTFALPVVAPLSTPYVESNPRIVGTELKRTLDKAQSEALACVLTSDPLFEMSHETKQIVWNARQYLIDVPQVLPKVLQCVEWGLQDYRNEAYRLLKCWATPANPIDALELLDARYPDYNVREYAVNILRRLSDEELQMYLLQLVQCIKFEPYHDSPLSRFLIERAVQNPYQIAHTLYWHLKAELHDPLVCERFSVMLEEMLSNVGIFADELQKQQSVVTKLQKVAEMIVQLKRELQYSDADAMKEYTKELEKLNKTFFEPMGKFQLPLNPKIECTSLIVEKCRFMSSKMVPLWLVFKNADENGSPIYVIFKSGDDLRQDLLTLQLLRVMDRLWLEQGLDMRLKPYSCIATGVNDDGDGVGMIEVVTNSDTTSGIQLKYGGGAMGALKLDPIDLFIREHNKDGKAHLRAVDNFVRSCAGYCVATFVLGIGDRHNGNIMVTKSGHLFHIDFGHFLGNFKKKFGVNRERAAFVFTPEMAFVMGGKDYKKHTLFSEFKKFCSKSFKVLRVNAALLENLFITMVAAGMPELMKETDILYLREKLHLDKDSKLANKELLDELKKSLDSTYRRIDNYIHNIRHG